MTRLLLAVFLISPILSAAVDACAMIPAAQVSGMLGTTKNKGMVSTAKQLPSKATDGKACTYVGKDNSATIVWYKFPTAAAAKDYLKSVRDSFEKQSYKTASEKFGDDEGFSFSNGMLAVRKNIWLRVNVNSTVSKVLAPDLTRQMMLNALRAN